MGQQYLKKRRLGEADLEFLVETVSPEVGDKSRLKQILREDEDFLNSYIADEKVFRRLMNEGEVFLRIGPKLFFEILLRHAARELQEVGYTLEKRGTMRIPVFDTQVVVELLKRESLLLYLADMLSSFTRIESYAVTLRQKPGIWKKIRFDDLDIPSLMALSELVEGEMKLFFYKRMADICLFILGIFPDTSDQASSRPGQIRPPIRAKGRMSPEEYAREGQKFYKLAAEHPSAQDLDLAEVFWALHQDFMKARKPLNYIADHYLRYRRQQFFH